jgi:hypothetical protein
VVAVVVVMLFALLKRDPILNLFTWISQVGTLAIIAMMAIASFAVISFFNKDGRGEGAWASNIAPIIAGLAMLALFVHIFANYGGLTRWPSGRPNSFRLPAAPSQSKGFRQYTGIADVIGEDEQEFGV